MFWQVNRRWIKVREPPVQFLCIEPNARAPIASVDGDTVPSFRNQGAAARESRTSKCRR